MKAEPTLTPNAKLARDMAELARSGEVSERVSRWLLAMVAGDAAEELVAEKARRRAMRNRKPKPKRVA